MHSDDGADNMLKNGGEIVETCSSWTNNPAICSRKLFAAHTYNLHSIILPVINIQAPWCLDNIHCI